MSKSRRHETTWGGDMDVDPLILGRVVERVLVVVFGGLSLFLGWRLFLVGVVDPQIAEIKFKNWKVSLRQVGPGSVFAALGIAVMAVALSRPLEISEAAKATTPAATARTARTVSYMSTPEDLRHWVRVLNTFARLDVDGLQQESVTSKAIRSELTRAQQAVVGIRDILLLEKFSQPDIAAWQKYQDAYLRDPLSVPGEIRVTLARLESWMTTTIADER
jgi:hypothetical protein